MSTKNRAKLANIRQLIAILNDQSIPLTQKLSSNVSQIQLSLPTDGRGPRIQVSVRPQDVNKVPESTEWTIEGEQIKIPLEVKGDYQNYEALTQ